MSILSQPSLARLDGDWAPGYRQGMDWASLLASTVFVLAAGGAAAVVLRRRGSPEGVAQRGDAERLAALLAAEPDLVGRRFAGGFTLLHRAGSRDVASLLFSKGADLEAVTDEGWTPLHMAAMHGNGALAEQLLGRGAKVDPRDKAGRTPLDLAGGSEPVTRILSEAGGTPA